MSRNPPRYLTLDEVSRLSTKDLLEYKQVLNDIYKETKKEVEILIYIFKHTKQELKARLRQLELSVEEVKEEKFYEEYKNNLN